jgi:plastocyanin
MTVRILSYALFAATIALAGAQAAAMADPNVITIKNFDYAPMALTVAAGTTVTWRNLDGEPHTVVSTDGLFRSAALDTNESFTFKFTTPGTYKYICTIHPKMVATITVK